LFYSLHNYSTRRESLDLRVVNVPKLLTTTNQLKEQQQDVPFLPLNGDLRSNKDDKQVLRNRINELEQELNYLKLQLTTNL
jgi:hypothetical protein